MRMDCCRRWAPGEWGRPGPWGCFSWLVGRVGAGVQGGGQRGASARLARLSRLPLRAVSAAPVPGPCSRPPPFCGSGVTDSALNTSVSAPGPGLCAPPAVRDFQIALTHTLWRFESSSAENQFFINELIVTLREEL